MTIGKTGNSVTVGAATFAAGNVGIGTVTANYKLHVIGSIFATDSIVSLSDQSVKTNVTTIRDALNLVNSLRGVRYNRIDTGQQQIGMIAQEVNDVVPEVVSVSPTGMAVSYGNLVGVLIEALKELQIRVEVLERLQTSTL